MLSKSRVFYKPLTPATPGKEPIMTKEEYQANDTVQIAFIKAFFYSSSSPSMRQYFARNITETSLRELDYAKTAVAVDGCEERSRNRYGWDGFLGEVFHGKDAEEVREILFNPENDIRVWAK